MSEPKGRSISLTRMIVFILVVGIAVACSWALFASTRTVDYHYKNGSGQELTDAKKTKAVRVKADGTRVYVRDWPNDSAFGDYVYESKAVVFDQDTRPAARIGAAIAILAVAATGGAWLVMKSDKPDSPDGSAAA
jgi:hypothetical protein